MTDFAFAPEMRITATPDLPNVVDKAYIVLLSI